MGATLEQPATVDVVVQYQSGAYVTQTVQGKRASNTTSAEAAMKALALKLHGSAMPVMRVRDLGVARELWRMPALRSAPGGAPGSAT